MLIALGAITPELEEWLQQIAAQYQRSLTRAVQELPRRCADTSFAFMVSVLASAHALT